MKNSGSFHISAQNIDCGYLLEPLGKAVLTNTTIYDFSRNKKNNAYPCKPQFYYIKVLFKGIKWYRHVFVMKFNPLSGIHTNSRRCTKWYEPYFHEKQANK